MTCPHVAAWQAVLLAMEHHRSASGDVLMEAGEHERETDFWVIAQGTCAVAVRRSRAAGARLSAPALEAPLGAGKCFGHMNAAAATETVRVTSDSCSLWRLGRAVRLATSPTSGEGRVSVLCSGAHFARARAARPPRCCVRCRGRPHTPQTYFEIVNLYGTNGGAKRKSGNGSARSGNSSSGSMELPSAGNVDKTRRAAPLCPRTRAPRATDAAPPRAPPAPSRASRRPAREQGGAPRRRRQQQQQQQQRGRAR